MLMYGWRRRIGLIVPSSNTTNEPEFQRWLPDGVSLYTTRMELRNTNAAALERMSEQAEAAGERLADADVDVVVYGCTTGSLVKGPGYDLDLESRLEAVAGVPAVATAASIKRAFEALDIDRLSVATPYIEDLNERERSFLEAAGYDVVAIDGLGIEPNLEIGALGPEEAYRVATQVDRESAEAVFISCTNFRTFEVVRTLEADLDKPVVTSNTATLWDALRTIGLGVPEWFDELGTLFRV